jgi:hypothetical protein
MADPDPVGITFSLVDADTGVVVDTQTVQTGDMGVTFSFKFEDVEFGSYKLREYVSAKNLEYAPLPITISGTEYTWVYVDANGDGFLTVGDYYESTSSFKFGPADAKPENDSIIKNTTVRNNHINEGTLIIKKEFNENNNHILWEDDEDTVFRARVKVSENLYMTFGNDPHEPGSYIYTGVNATGSIAEFSVNAFAKINGIPEDIICVIQENEREHCSATYSTEYLTIIKGEDNIITVVNSYEEPEPDDPPPTTEEDTTEEPTEDETEEDTTEEPTEDETEEDTTEEPTEDETEEDTTEEPTEDETEEETTEEKTTEEPTTEPPTTPGDPPPPLQTEPPITTTEEPTTEPPTTTQQPTTTTESTTVGTTGTTTEAFTSTTEPTITELITKESETAAPESTAEVPTREIEEPPTVETPTEPIITEPPTTENETIKSEPVTTYSHEPGEEMADDMIPLENGWFAMWLEDDLYEIFDQNGTPLGYIRLPEGFDIEDYDVEGNLIPLWMMFPEEEKPKSNPITEDNIIYLILLLIISLPGIYMYMWRRKKVGLT